MRCKGEKFVIPVTGVAGVKEREERTEAMFEEILLQDLAVVIFADFDKQLLRMVKIAQKGKIEY